MIMATDFEQHAELVLHNLEYLLCVSVRNGDTLCVEVEQRNDGSRWRGEFEAQYVEEITQKTGSFKRFPIFVRMLRSAVTQESESVFVDLLSYTDLEALKNKKAGAQAAGSRRPTSNNKRYLILTYTAEYDRVHYPLPLLYEEHPEPVALKGTIKRLRDEVEFLRSQLTSNISRSPKLNTRAGLASRDSDVDRLKEENEALREELQSLQEDGAHARPDGEEGGAAEQIGELQNQLDRAKRENRFLQAKLDASCEELGRLKPGRSQAERELEMLRRRIQRIEEDATAERNTHKRAVTRLAKENAGLTDELQKLKEVEKRLRVKLREAEGQLDILRRRLSLRGRETAPLKGRPSAPNSRNPSPATSRNPTPPVTARDQSNRSRNPSPRFPTRDISPPAFRRPFAAVNRSWTPPSSRPPSRPASAPTTYRRFDPTAYVRERSEKLRQGRAGSSERQRSSSADARDSGPDVPRGVPRYQRATAAASARARGFSSASPSPVRERSPQTRQWGQNGREQPAAPVRRSSTEYNRPPTGLQGGRSAPVSPSRADWDRVGTRNGNGNGNGLPPRLDEDPLQPSSRSSSPGRALRDVKERLAKYVSKESGESVPGSKPANDLEGLASGSDAGRLAATEPQSVHAIADDTSAEIADIDSRLHALQNFLRAAKSASGGHSSVS